MKTSAGKKSEQKLKRILKKQFSNVIDPCPLINSTYWLPLLRHQQQQQQPFHHHHHQQALQSCTGGPAAAVAAASSTSTTAIVTATPTQQSALLSQQSISDGSDTGTSRRPRRITWSDSVFGRVLEVAVSSEEGREGRGVLPFCRSFVVR